ncbi:MAG: ABC transporter permease, partial [Vicinamibacterales bacterium]
MTRAGIAIVLITVLAALAAPWLLPWDPATQDLALRLQGPSFQHLFGLDELGRDILARVLLGARVSLMVGVVVVGVSTSVGMAVGAVAGYYGGWIDQA